MKQIQKTATSIFPKLPFYKCVKEFIVLMPLPSFSTPIKSVEGSLIAAINSSIVLYVVTGPYRSNQNIVPADKSFSNAQNEVRPVKIGQSSR